MALPYGPFNTTSYVPSVICGEYLNSSTGFIETWFNDTEVWRERNNFGMKLVMIIICVNGLQSISFIWGAIVQLWRLQSERNLCDMSFWKCKAQAAMTNYTEVSSYCWMICLATFLFLTLVRHRSQSRFEGCYERWFHAVSWGTPLVCVIVGLTAEVYGPSGQWCWINPPMYRQRSGQVDIVIYQVMLDGAWLSLSIGWNILVLFLSVRSIRRLLEAGLVSNKPGNAIKWTMYGTVFVFLTTHGFSIINRSWIVLSYRYINPGDEKSAHVFVLHLLQSILEPAQGFMFACLYGSNPIVWRAYRDKCCYRTLREEEGAAVDGDMYLTSDDKDQALLPRPDPDSDPTQPIPIITSSLSKSDRRESEEDNHICGSYDTPFTSQIKQPESPITYKQELVEDFLLE